MTLRSACLIHMCFPVVHLRNELSLPWNQVSHNRVWMHIFVLTIPILLFFPWWDSVSLCVLSWHVSSPEHALVFRLAMPVLTRLHIIFWSYIDRKTLDFWGDKPFGLFPVTLPIWKRWQNVMWNGKKELGMLLSRHKWAVTGHPRPPAKVQPS